MSGATWVQVRRVGPRVLFEVPNLRFRAEDGEAAERRAAEESFATSVLWGTEAIVVEESGRSLIDLREFLLRDGHGVGAALERAGQGTYTLDLGRSMVEIGELLVFPDNVELESTLTFVTSGPPGREVRSTAPLGDAVSVIQHISFVRLPAPGYRPRAFDPRIGTFSIGYRDYSTPLDRPIEVRAATRHRLAAGETITYHVDRGAPEPIRSALIEGASWWSEAFAAAGFPDAFRVELLPEGAHPLDVRYHVIQWVHRATRGWSYGMSMIDPRTGEILKGHVSLGSLRVRQDRLLFEGLVGAEKTGSGAPDDPIELALARIRQLAAHEVGHTLGLSHNFAASTQGRASVMDYPPPRVGVTEAGELDVSDAYGVGIGEWDRHVIRYLYSDFGGEESAEEAGLLAIVEEGLAKGHLFLSDADARSAGGSDPRASLWDDGADAIEGLENAVAVRRVAIDRFGPENLAKGQPLARMEEVFAPVYFHHRYALEAAVKEIGGVEYRHVFWGDGQPLPRAVAGDRQRRALEAVLDTLSPEFLRVPESVVDLLVPRSPGSLGSTELFTGRSHPIFDPLSAAETATALVVGGLLVEERLSRLVTQVTRDEDQLTLEEFLTALSQRFRRRDEKDRTALEIELDRVVERAIVDGLIHRAGSETVSPAVRVAIDGVHGEVAAKLGPPFEAKQLRIGNGYRATLIRDIERHLARTPGERVGRAVPPPAPPGSPIGCGCDGGGSQFR